MWSMSTKTTTTTSLEEEKFKGQILVSTFQDRLRAFYYYKQFARDGGTLSIQRDSNSESS